MNLFKVQSLIAVALIATACSTSDEVLIEENTVVNVLATVSNASTHTRTTDAVYTPQGGMLHLSYGAVGGVVSTEFVCNDGAWIASAPLYWNNLTAVDGSYPFFAVAPSIPAASPVASADQSTRAAYVGSDQLVAFVSVPKRLTALPLTFKHMLSQINVTITASVPATDAAYLDPASATLTIGGTRTAYTISYDGATSEIPAIATATTDAEPIAALSPNKQTNGFYAVVPAQTFAAGELTLAFTIAGKPYAWKNSEAISSVAGMNTVVNLEVKKSGISLAANGIKLTEWEVSSTTDEEIEIEK